MYFAHMLFNSATTNKLNDQIQNFLLKNAIALKAAVNSYRRVASQAILRQISIVLPIN